MAETVVLFDNGVKGMRVKVKVEGHTMEEIDASVKRLSKVSPSILNTPTKKSATIVARLAQAKAPRKTGALAGGILVSKKEKSKTRGKVVYDVYMDPSKNDIFQKRYASKLVSSKRSNGGHAYYPASQEYGFTRTTSKGTEVTVAGIHFMRDAAEGVDALHEQIVIDHVWKKLEKQWTKEQGANT